MKLRNSIPVSALVGRENPQEQKARSSGSSGHMEGDISPAGRTFGRGCPQQVQKDQDHTVRIFRPQHHETRNQPREKMWKDNKYLETKDHPTKE